MESKLALTASGTIAFVTHAAIKTDKCMFLKLSLLCRGIARFIALTSDYWERASYFGEFLLTVNLAVASPTTLLYQNGGILADQSHLLFTPEPKSNSTFGVVDKSVIASNEWAETGTIP